MTNGKGLTPEENARLDAAIAAAAAELTPAQCARLDAISSRIRARDVRAAERRALRARPENRPGFRFNRRTRGEG